MQKLEIGVQPYGTEEEVLGNIKHSLGLSLPELAIAPSRHDGNFVIVGSSPSVVNHLDMIRGHQAAGHSICAINGGHDFLMENEVVPNLFLTTDPRPMPQNFKHLNDTTVYLIASRCAPETFAALKGRQILLWHCWADNFEAEGVRGKMAIGGGTTSGLRAINVAYVLGYRNIHLYGMDSCLGENKEKRWDAGPMTDEVKTIDVILGDRTFICNMAMAQQANDFQYVYDVMPDIHISAYGNGLIQAIIEERDKLGLST